ncbi:MAG TPA: hypothetical protein VK116_13260 [Planctomycetota bacterium]|nr:hypothetical protein [Planctomycetota bacterium]
MTSRIQLGSLVAFLVVAIATGCLVPSPATNANEEPRESAPSTEAGRTIPSFGLRIDGRWILDADGEAVEPDDFRRGLQTSALTFHRRSLWSVGDQRSEYPGSLLEIDPESARLRGSPLRIEVADDVEADEDQLRRFREIPNIDLEGLAPANATKTDALDGEIGFVAVTEDKEPWLLFLTTQSSAPGAERAPLKLIRLSRLDVPLDLRPWRDDTNFRVEGITVLDGDLFVIAFERAHDNLPRLLTLGKELNPAPLPIDFSSLPPRVDKPRALLNVNGLESVRWRDRSLLLALARDQERIVVIDAETSRILHFVDLDLRDPDGHSIEWASPEGIAADVATDRLWLVSDPDSVRGNYRRRDSEKADGPYASYVPLLFTTKLSAVIDGAAAPDDSQPAKSE